MTQTKWIGLALIICGAAACGSGGGGTSASAQSLGEKCATDADCKGANEACVANVCAPKLPGDLGVTLCKQTSDCAAGDICVAAVCLPQHVGGATFCDKDADCATGDQCLAQVCVPQLPAGGGVPGLPFDLGLGKGVGQKCKVNADCTNGLDCAFGFCLPLQTCKSDADCTGQQTKCETHAGICI